MQLQRISMLAVALGVAACGTGGDADADDTLGSFRALADEMSAAVQSYGTDSAALSSDADCTQLHAGYGAHMAGAAHRMRELGAELDGHMSQRGPGMGDVGCVGEAIAAELDRHHAAACGSGDLATDRGEAAQHVEAMHALLEHQHARARDGAAGMGGMHQGGTFTCVRNADGSFTFDGEPWAPGCIPGEPQPAPSPTP